MLDLYHASRDELVALVLSLREQHADLGRRLTEQQAAVAVLRALVADLTARVGEALAAAEPAEPPDAEPGGSPRGMPGLKPGPPPARPGQPRRQRARGCGRRRLEPTARQGHAVDHCPNCRLPL